MRVGIILLEMLKPYGVTAENVARVMPENVKSVIFLEEEIHSGGMGVNLCEKLTALGVLDGLRHSIMSVDDSFVDERPEGEHIYKTAGIDSESIICELDSLLG